MQDIQEPRVWSLGWEDSLEKEVAAQFSILVWKIPWTEEPGGLCPWGCCKDLDMTVQLNTHTHTRLTISPGKKQVSIISRTVSGETEEIDAADEFAMSCWVQSEKFCMNQRQDEIGSGEGWTRLYRGWNRNENKYLESMHFLLSRCKQKDRIWSDHSTSKCT